MWVDNSKSRDDRYVDPQITFWLIEISSTQSKDGAILTSSAREIPPKKTLKETKKTLRKDSIR